MTKIPIKTTLFAIIILGAILRIIYAADSPLNGDETGFSLLQASGQAVTYAERIPENIVPISQIRSFASYSKDFSLKDVLASLRTNGGMHPPFYYIILHFVLKYAGDSALMLRSLSILISLFSIYFIYILGRNLFNNAVGIYSAFFLSLSAYGVMFGSMVRPYPLTMALALLSTIQIYELNRSGELTLRNKKFWLYIITAILGLYTIYHFVFVILFQIVSMLIYSSRGKKRLIAIAMIPAILFVLYLPWLPNLFDQLKVVGSNTFYFHGPARYNPVMFIKYTLFTNFTRIFVGNGSLMQLSAFTDIVLLIFVAAGSYFSLKNAMARYFSAAFIFYLLFNYLSDRFLKMHTLSISKLYFFIVPALFILIAAGIFYGLRRNTARNCCAALLCGLLLANSIVILYHKPVMNTPYELRNTAVNINGALKSGGRDLLIINAAERRYLLSLVHAINFPVDIKILQNGRSAHDEINRLKDIRRYDEIYFINFDIGYDKDAVYNAKDSEIILKYIRSQDKRLTIIDKFS